MRSKVGLQCAVSFLAAACFVTLIVLMLVLNLDKQLPDLDEYVLKHGLLRCLVNLLHEPSLVTETHASVPRNRSNLPLLLAIISILEYLIYPLWYGLLQMLNCIRVLRRLSFWSAGLIDGVQLLGSFRSSSCDSTNGNLHFYLSFLGIQGLRTRDLGVAKSAALLDLTELRTVSWQLSSFAEYFGIHYMLRLFFVWFGSFRF